MNDSKKRFIESLMKYFASATVSPSQMEAKKERGRLMYQTLPVMTDDESRELLIRLLKRCKYEPTIAEIMDEWRTMRRCSRPVVFTAKRVEKPVFNPKVAKLLQETRAAIREGRPVAVLVMHLVGIWSERAIGKTAFFLPCANIFVHGWLGVDFC